MQERFANSFEQRSGLDPEEGPIGSGIEIIQANVGLVCNQECVHCHVSASPKRKEVMQWETMELILLAAKKTECRLIDITGGAPELNPNFRRFVEAIRSRDIPAQVRTNLTVLLEPDMEGTMEFLREHKVALVASLPCYLEENVRAQRGPGVYEKSIEAIRRLNELGYGKDPELPLDLVYNPIGPVLPPEQSTLEADYRSELGERYGIEFTKLLTITNMPIGRFLAWLRRENRYDDYTSLLEKSFNERTLEGLMCRHMLSVRWDGTLFDCDFNLALGLPVNHGAPEHIRDFDPVLHPRRRIVTGEHCFGCTAGCGSSCRGALIEGT